MFRLGGDPRRGRGNFWRGRLLRCGLSSKFFDYLFYYSYLQPIRRRQRKGTATVLTQLPLMS